MRNRFGILDWSQKKGPGWLYSQSWIYAGISAYYGQQDQFDKLEFQDFDEPFIVLDWEGKFIDGVKNYGLVYEGHADYWIGSCNINSVPDDILFVTGHEHYTVGKDYTSVGFDYWDHVIFKGYGFSALHYEINRSPLDHAVYDVVIPVGSPRAHRKEFMMLLEESRGDLSIVTDNRQPWLNTDLRFRELGIEVYFNKYDIKDFASRKIYTSFFSANDHRSLDHLPHKKMHAIARVNVALETTVYDTESSYLTEKTYKILAQGRPFVILGDTNILSKLKSQGFQTFDKFCDESYDAEKDVTRRMHKVIEAIKQLNESCKKYPAEIDEICRHNQNWYFNPQRPADGLAKFGKRMLEIIDSRT